MSKKLLSILFASLLFLSACGDPGESETKETAQDEEEEVEVEKVDEEVDGNYKGYSINDLKYTVLESWTEETSDENLKYYYPENGMLMVGFEELGFDDAISNDELREGFLEGFTSNLESVELISESKTTIEGKTAYQYNMNNVWNKGEGEAETSLVVFDYHDGIISFMMSTPSDSDKDYNNDFENVLNSIEYTEQTTQKVEEEVEESNGNEIVLGEPIELGEYTLIIQGYSLGVDYEGNDALIIEYDWVNNSEDTTSPFMTFNLKGFQDDVETDYSIMVEGADIGTGQKDVRPGGTIEGAQTTVSISDITKPLELELNELFSLNSDPFIAEIDLSKLD